MITHSDYDASRRTILMKDDHDIFRSSITMLESTIRNVDAFSEKDLSQSIKSLLQS
jgi:hypothetical protein